MEELYVMAIKKSTFNKIEVYGSGQVIGENDEGYIVKLDELPNDVILVQDYVPLNKWQEYVDLTCAKVKRVKHNKVIYKGV